MICTIYVEVLIVLNCYTVRNNYLQLDLKAVRGDQGDLCVLPPLYFIVTIFMVMSGLGQTDSIHMQ